MNIFIWFIQTIKRKLVNLTRLTVGYIFCMQIKIGYQLFKQLKYTLKKMLPECT